MATGHRAYSSRPPPPSPARSSRRRSSLLEPYTYHTLSSGISTRILELQGSPRHDSELQTRLFEVSLSNAPPYEAISYAWEGQSPSEKILCDGKQLVVTENCAIALRRFRPDLPQETRLVWIDFVCINQNSLAERNHQVQLMGEIYRKATQVLVWLGEPIKFQPNHNSYLAIFRWLQHASRVAVERPGQEAENIIINKTKNIDDQELHDFLFEITWFSRRWALQELVLAKEALFIFGAESLPFHAFYRLAICISNLSSDTYDVERVWALIHNRLAPHIHIKERLMSKSKEAEPLSRFFLDMRWLEASNPRDQIFAIHGLLSDLGVVLPPPDYSKPITTIYREAYRAVIEYDCRCKSLSSLNYGTIEASIPGLPSWVPKLVGKPISPPPAPSYLPVTHHPEIHFSDDGFQLHCQGLHMGSVRSCAGESVLYTSSLKNLSQVYKPRLLQALGGSKDQISAATMLWNTQVYAKFTQFASFNYYRPQSEQALEALYMCLRGGHAKPRSEKFQREYEDYREFVRVLSEGFTRLDELRRMWDEGMQDNVWGDDWRGSLDLADLVLTDEFQVLKLLMGQDSLKEVFELISDTIGNFTIFATNRGELGIGNFSIQPGDEIIYFSGNDHPLVLRPKDGLYKIVAAVYIHELLDNVMWDENSEAFREYTII